MCISVLLYVSALVSYLFSAILTCGRVQPGLTIGIPLADPPLPSSGVLPNISLVECSANFSTHEPPL